MSQLFDRGLELLRQSLGRDDAQFREHQWEAIETLVEKRGRLLVIERTGWGKSSVYFIATRLMRDQGYGPTIIISPLLALMRNQIDAAAGYGVGLGTINSSNSRTENSQASADLLAGELDAIVISPEQLAKPGFVENTLRPIGDTVGLFVIDEAHCISTWGHDFRPDYKRIGGILRFLPSNMPVLATTATANERVTQDMAEQLGESPMIIRGRLTRESLHLQSIVFPKQSQRLAWLADTVPRLDGTGIIYVATIRAAELVAAWLKHRGLDVEAYYGSIPGREELEERLSRNQLKALVATSALGMGYDKPDLSFVIHFQSPGSVITYYQQVGRAGRAIPQAHGVLLSGAEDDSIQQFFIRNAFPEEGLVAQILELLDSSDDGLRPMELQQRINERPKKIEAALRFLAAESPAPILKTESPVRYQRTLIEYELPYDVIQRVSLVKEREWQTMQQYVGHQGCLMQFLARELDDHETGDCGRCQNCSPETQLSTEYSHEAALAAVGFLENVDIEIPPRKKAETSEADVARRFPAYGFPLYFRELEHESGRALCYWGEAGWGEIAMHGKRAGQFDPRLIGASARLIRDRWQPEPMPTWVTFVPSLNHPELVPRFARGLAEQLGLPCLDVVKMMKDNRPQKEMENAHHRCRNLDGVFEISADVESEPVLLVDDAWDSGWTFAVIAALLRRAGAGPVFPFAIMSTSTSS